MEEFNRKNTGYKIRKRKNARQKNLSTRVMRMMLPLPVKVLDCPAVAGRSTSVRAVRPPPPGQYRGGCSLRHGGRFLWPLTEAQPPCTMGFRGVETRPRWF